jgi:uncharacterized membrane protein
MKKTLSFAVIHFSVAFSLTYLLTGSIILGGALALLEPAVNTLAFYIHESYWNRKQYRESMQELLIQA